MEKKHVLVVDDDLILLKTAEEILSEFYSVSVAKAGSQAIALLEKGVIPDLILLDIAMPGMDGYETLNEMKKIPAAGSVPIIFLTGFSDADYEVQRIKIRCGRLYCETICERSTACKSGTPFTI